MLGERMDRAELRRVLIEATISEVPFEGWSMRAARAAARGLGLASEEAERAFPRGASELIEVWQAVLDEAVIEAMGREPLDQMKVRERVTRAVQIRLELLAPHREAVRRELAYLALPGHAGLAARLLYRTVDTLWFAAGDRAADFSFYTKRALLAGVYSSTLLFWLADASDDASATRAFLDRRIAGVMRIPKLRKRLEEAAGSLPDPLGLLRRMRPAPQAR